MITSENIFFDAQSKKLYLMEKSCCFSEIFHFLYVKVTQREKAPSNKTQALTKSMNMVIWVVDTSNQLFRRGSYTETKFPKKLISYWQNSALCDRSILYSPLYLS